MRQAKGKRSAESDTQRPHIAVLKNHFGSIAAAAKALDITPNAIYMWPTVPPKRAEDLEKITRGRLKYKQLRPAA